MAQEQALLRGTVGAVIFNNPENGYTVLKLQSEDGELITVVGVIPLAVVGERLLITGKWVTHGTYGMQFEAEFLERLMPDTKQGILAYLASGAVKGVGKKTAEKIVKAFGTRALDVLENDPMQLTQIGGISESKAERIANEFQKQTGIRRLVEYLCVNGVAAQYAMRTYRIYGPESMQILSDDPYLLTQEEIGAPFAAVDLFARRFGVEENDVRRLRAGVLYEMTYNFRNGHVFLPMEKLCQATAMMLQQAQEDIMEAIASLLDEQELILDRVAGLEALYQPRYYDAERYVARRICEMAAHGITPPKGLSGLLERVQARTGLEYGEEQRTAILAAAEHRILIVTGGPGTGKTTTMNGILELFSQMGLKTQLAAPTGRAAKRLSELTGQAAATIHRLLEVGISPQTGQMEFHYDEDNPMKLDALIVDEMSMVDLLLMQALLKALPVSCRLILVGDPDQLPSVGVGNVFSDLLRSGVAHTVRLTQIYRQASQSLIVMNAHAVNHGELPRLDCRDNDFFFLRRTSPQSVVQTIVELCRTRLPQNMGILPQDIQVLSPMRKGETGTVFLNQQLQQALNPPAEWKKEKKHGAFSYREGDRVMQIRNNYDIIWEKADASAVGAGIFNGDVGIIQEISLQNEQMRILFDDRIVAYPFELLSDLELAYAMTVHKSQGSEYRAVIVSVLGGSPYLLSRNVLYTALTRAREMLILVGTEQTIAAMTQNNQPRRRYSGLKLRLQAGG